jgi:hypothetical protein
MRSSMLGRGVATASLLVLPSCWSGMAEMAREYRAERERAFEAHKAACFCASGARCDSLGSGYPESPWVGPASAGQRCCISANCAEGLVCDTHAAPAPDVCAPIEVVAEKETIASCAESAPKIWDREPALGCRLTARDSRGYEALRWSSGSNIDRIRYIVAADVATLSSIDRGVFVVLSGAGSRALGPTKVPPSIWMLRELLGKTDPSLDVVVAEKHCLTKDLVVRLKLRCDDRGDGEMAWIRRGEIVATTGYGFHPEKIEPNTQRLLSLP